MNLSTDAHLYRECVNPKLSDLWKILGLDAHYTRAEGPYLWTEEGRRILDLNSGYGAFVMGRNHPKVRERLRDYLDRNAPSLIKFGAPELAGQLAQKLKDSISTPFDYVSFANTGAEAIEMAMSFAQIATGRNRFIYCESSYHGLTANARSVSGEKTFCDPAWDLEPGSRVRIPFNDLHALETALATHDIAALIVEPIQGKTLKILDDAFLSEARRLCHARGAALIVDEIQTGMGRTGKFLALEHGDPVVPDMITLSKSLGGGYAPLSAILTQSWIHSRVFNSFPRAAAAFSTFSENGLALTAGLAALEVIEEEKLCQRAESLGAQLLDGLKDCVHTIPIAAQARGRGLMLGIEIGRPKLGFGPAALAQSFPESLIAQSVIIPLYHEQGILAQVSGPNSNLIKFLPPSVLSENDVDWVRSGVRAALETANHRPQATVAEIATRVLRREKDGLKPHVDQEIESTSLTDIPTEASTPTVCRRPSLFLAKLSQSAIQSNAILALRVFIGLIAAVGFAIGGATMAIYSSVGVVLSKWLNQTHGALLALRGFPESKRPQGTLAASACVNISIFAGLTLGILRSAPIADARTATLGVLALAGVGFAYLRVRSLERKKANQRLHFPLAGWIESSDLIYLAGPIVWIGGPYALLVSGALGAPIFAGILTKRSIKTGGATQS